MDVQSEYGDADTISIDTLVLEKSVLQKRDKEIKELRSLSKKVSFLHSNILYYEQKSALGTACSELWKTLIKKVGGTPNGWHDLGCALGISQDDLNFIKLYTAVDHVDMVFRVFRQDENATIDKILDAFIKLNRYDILKSIEGPLCQIAQYFYKDESGYHSNSSEQKVIRLKNLPNDLPAALNKNYVNQNKNPKEPIMRLPAPTTERIVNEKPILFLTYTYDGLPTALNIQMYVKSWDMPNVEVITLENKKEELYQNPEKFIRESFEKANFIIPVLTLGYLEEIRSHNPAVPNTSDNLDHKYASFIYNLIVNHYIHGTGCLNKKVRSVWPQNTNPVLLKKLSMYPDLMPWTYEKDFDEQFITFLKMEYS